MNANPIGLKSAVEKHQEYTGWREFHLEARELPPAMPEPVTNKKAKIP